MGLKPWTLGLFLASLGHFLAPLPLISAAHASEQNPLSCGGIFPTTTSLDLHQAYQHQPYSQAMYQSVYQYATKRAEVYKKGLIFIQTDTHRDADHLLATFKNGDRFQFDYIFSFDPVSKNYIGKRIQHFHDLEALTHSVAASDVSEKVVLAGTTHDFKVFADHMIQDLHKQGDTDAQKNFWDIFSSLSTTNIFLLQTPPQTQSFEYKLMAYTAGIALKSHGKISLVEFSSQASDVQNITHRQVPLPLVSPRIIDVTPSSPAPQNQVLRLPAPSEKKEAVAAPIEKPSSSRPQSKVAFREPSDQMKEKAKLYVDYLQRKLLGKEIDKDEDKKFRKWISNMRYRISDLGKKTRGGVDYSLESLFTKQDTDFLLEFYPNFFKLGFRFDEQVTPSKELVASMIQKHYGVPAVSIAPSVLKQAERYVVFMEKLHKLQHVSPKEKADNLKWLDDMNHRMNLPEGHPQKIKYSFDDLFTAEQKMRMGSQKKEEPAAETITPNQDQVVETEALQAEAETRTEEEIIKAEPALPTQVILPEPKEREDRRHAAIAALPEKARNFLELTKEKIHSDEFEDQGEDFLFKNESLEVWFQTFMRNNQSGITKYAWTEYFTKEELLRLHNYALIPLPESVLQDVQLAFPGQIVLRTAHLAPEKKESAPELVFQQKKAKDPSDKTIRKQFPLQENPGRIVLPQNTKGLSALEIAALYLEQNDQQQRDLLLSDHPHLEETPVPVKTKAQLAAFNRLKKSVEEKHQDFQAVLSRIESYFTVLHDLVLKDRFSSEKLIYYTEQFQLKKRDLKDIAQRIQDADELNHLRAADVMMMSIHGGLEILERSLLEESKNLGAGKSTLEKAIKELTKNQKNFDQEKNTDDQARAKAKASKQVPSNQITQALQKALPAETQITQTPVANPKADSTETSTPPKKESSFLSRMLSASKQLLGLEPKPQIETMDGDRPLHPQEEQILQAMKPTLKNPPSEQEQLKIQTYRQQWKDLESSINELAEELQKHTHPSLDLTKFQKSFADYQNQFMVDSTLMSSTERGSQLDKIMKTAERLLGKTKELEAQMNLWVERFQTTDLKSIVAQNRVELLLSDRVYSFTPKHIQPGAKSETIKVRFSENLLKDMFYDLKDEKSKLAAIGSLDSILDGFHDERMDLFRPQRVNTPVIVRVKNTGRGVGKIRIYGVLENGSGSQDHSVKLNQISFVYKNESENFDQTHMKHVYDATFKAAEKMYGQWKSKFSDEKKK